jgi:hypothetical protein
MLQVGTQANLSKFWLACANLRRKPNYLKWPCFKKFARPINWNIEWGCRNPCRSDCADFDLTSRTISVWWKLDSAANEFWIEKVVGDDGPSTWTVSHRFHSVVVATVPFRSIQKFPSRLSCSLISVAFSESFALSNPALVCGRFLWPTQKVITLQGSFICS